MNGDYLRDLHREVREELIRIDGKASVLLGFIGVVVSLVGGAFIVGDASVERVSAFLAVVLWVAFLLAFVAIVSVVLSLTPVTKAGTTAPHPTYFGHVTKLASPEALAEALEGADPVQRVLEQTYTLSLIAQRKYRLTTISITSFGGALVLSLVVGAFSTS